MNENDFLLSAPLPFCAGCGHHLVARHTARALAKLGLKPLDVVLVTDIGCHGIIDRFFLTHTVHGLHGRAAALGAGIAAALDPDKKVVVFIGDGGASIGLQHLLECARRNFPITIVLHNNMLYGMTGGQPSSLTPCGFRTPLIPEGKPDSGYDICQLIHRAGAPYVARILGAGEFSAVLAEAFAEPGFSLVEVIETCPSYGFRYNPGEKPQDIARRAGLEFGVWRNPDGEKPVMRLPLNRNRPSLLEELKNHQPPDSGQPNAESRQRTAECGKRNGGRLAILIAGSAGGRVQQAAEALAGAAIATGLYATKKGTYPVTVGTGYSVAEVMLSPQPILYTGGRVPDVAIVVSDDGLGYVRGLLSEMSRGIVIIDESLTPPPSAAKVVRQPFQKATGPRNATLLALLFLLRLTHLLPVEALIEQVKTAGRTRDEEVGKMLEQLESLLNKTKEEHSD